MSQYLINLSQQNLANMIEVHNDFLSIYISLYLTMYCLLFFVKSFAAIRSTLTLRT